MNNFEIYVKTSALGKRGIHWRKIESEDYQPAKEPSLIYRKVVEAKNGEIAIVNDLLDEVNPSLLILRDKEQQKLLLEITGIESPQRSTRLGRKVLNSLVFIADEQEENEQLLRIIACCAIKNILHKDFSVNNMIEKSVNFHELEEFRVDLKEVNNFIEHIVTIERQNSSDIKYNFQYKIQCKSSESLQELTDELENYCLPKEWQSWDGQKKTDGVLVVVTENLENRTLLHKAGVWRGLANNIKEPVLEIVEKEEKKNETTSVLQEESAAIPSPSRITRLGIILTVVVLVILLIVIIISLKLPRQIPPQPTPETQLQPTPQIELNQPPTLPQSTPEAQTQQTFQI